MFGEGLRAGETGGTVKRVDVHARGTRRIGSDAVVTASSPAKRGATSGSSASPGPQRYLSGRIPADRDPAPDSTAAEDRPRSRTSSSKGRTRSSAGRAGDSRTAVDTLLPLARIVRAQLSTLSLDLDLPDVDGARRERDLVLAHVDDYLIPRLLRMDAPLLAVIGGSTGAGKSTLMNSLAGKEVSRSGVLRPTTRSPVLVHHPYDSGAFLSQRILPGLDRITSEALEPVQPVELDAPRITALRLVPHEDLVPGLALLDAPDIDSVVEANRELAVQLLGAGDLCLFVTTAARYSDAMPWEMLRDAADRGASVAVVLDRVPPETMSEVRTDLARMLRDEGLASSPVFTIPETTLVNGLLPRRLVASLLRWLTRLASDGRSRDMVIRRTLAGALDSLPERIERIVAASGEQEASVQVLRSRLEEIWAEERALIATQLSDGTVLRGEARARWRHLVAEKHLMRHVERAGNRMTDRLLSSVRRPAPLHADGLGKSVELGARAVLSAGAFALVGHTAAAWESRPGGARLRLTGELDRFRVEIDQRAVRVVREWQSALTAELEEKTRRGIPEWAVPLGAHGIGVLAMVAAFSLAARTRADRAGIEVDEAATEVAPSQQVLAAILGEETTRAVLLRAHERLLVAADSLCLSIRDQVQGRLDETGVLPGAGQALREAARALDEAR
jgi:energy-coupling factor transporter ATP-binding protein EcfA2